MCGICGIFDFNNGNPDPNDVRKMMYYMRHRGPDDEGVYSYNNVALGFVRLSIIDLSKSGNQPMRDVTGRYSIVFNGEIYNYIELRNELLQKGYKFVSKTDTEVLLYSYIEWGVKCLGKLNGMFAISIYDNVESELFIARDRYGIKPFYYTMDNGKFIFSSEILPIIKTFPQLKEVNDKAVYNYLLYNRTDYDNTTFFKNILKLPHGSFAVLKNKLNIKKWYVLSDNLKEGFESFEEYHDLLRSSVELRLRSDVPVGVCLSGGLDSSSIASVLIEDFKNTNINTFSAVYSENYKHDERKYINLYKSKLVNMNFVSPDAKSFLTDITDYILAHEEPVPTTNPYAQYKVMQLAKGNVKVTLDGQGADEQLAGYHYFFGYYFKELLLNFRFLKILNEVLLYYIKHRSLYGLKSFLFLLLPSQMQLKLRRYEKTYISDDFYRAYKGLMIIPDEFYSSSSLKQSFIDHFEMKLEHLLKWEDRNSMHFSIEARLPFMDYRIVHKTLSTKSDMIIKNGMTKYILRRAMRNILPEEIINRKDKVGFATPSDDWFRDVKFKEFIFDIIHSKAFNQRGYLNSSKIVNLYSDHLKGKVNISKDIWKWINLELWIRICIENQ